jgi:hypothetical protein
MPWITFLLIGAGVAVAVIALAAFLLGRVDGQTLTMAGVAVVIVAAIATVLPLTAKSVDAANRFRLQNHGTPPDQAREKCIVDGSAGQIVPLVRAARATLPAHARYAVIGPLGADLSCWAMNMLPRLMISTVRSGDWLLFTDGVEPGWRARLAPGSERPLGGNLAIGRQR